MAAVPLFYYRNGCHLCDELAAVLFRGWPDQAGSMEWRDVDQRPEWRDAYGEQVPVLIQGGETICALQPDLGRIAQYFGEMANPV
ncbi:MAG: glutaredoxin family protein [Gammaproteobacteria bacterium]|nr:glutaredoxin family protein [Gammaproteobacteria bacterium]